jgi:transglutaminase-like putative cysteine protease
MKNKLSFFCFIIINFSLLQARAQTFDEIRKLFPDEKAVLLNRSLEYNIDLKNGEPYVVSHEVQQIEYLLSSATAYMGQYGFSHSDFQKLGDYEAYTRTKDNKKLKVTEFKTSTNKQSFVFYDDVKETSFIFPAVEPGAIGNLQVSWHNTDPHLLSPYYFTGYMPAINSQLKVTVDKDISLKYMMMGLDTANILVTVDTKHQKNIYTFQYKNTPADKRYPDAPDYSWYSPHVIFYIESYKNEKGATVPYLSNANDLYKLNYSFIKSVSATLSPEMKHIVDSLTAGQHSPEGKAEKIYSWVQQNVKYVAFEDGMGGFVPRDASLVCSRRFGDCKDMASILTQMMNAAGVPAYFTWIGTRDLPYSFSKVPLPLVSNHMICAIKLNGNFVFLDATDPNCVFGMPSYGIQDKEAMISLSENEYKIVKVPVVDKSKNTLVDTTWLELTPNGVKGHIKQNRQGYFAMHTYGNLMYWDKKNMNEIMKGEFERGSNKFQLDTFSIDKKQTSNEITLRGNFTLPGYGKKIGDEYYLNLNLFKFFENEQIDYPRRKMPVEYNFKSVRKYVTLLKLPEGYKLAYLPQSKAYHNNIWGFNLQYQQKGQWLVLTQEFDNENLMLTYDQFEQWNKVLENLFPMYKETLGISKS